MGAAEFFGTRRGLEILDDLELASFAHIFHFVYERKFRQIKQEDQDVDQ